MRHILALSYPATTVMEIRRRFNRITYLKAAAILRMVEGVVGEALFRTGLRHFLLRFAYGNARADDLLATLDVSVGKNTNSPQSAGDGALNFTLVEFMDAWIYRVGFPLIEFSQLNASHSIIRQKFFSVQPPNIENKMLNRYVMRDSHLREFYLSFQICI